MTTTQTTIKTNPAQAWFDQARFGMFIHWGLYSLLERGEWVMFREAIPKEKYNKLAEQFDPDKFDANAWAQLAKRAGAKYLVLTTRHHDGFCLYDSKVSQFNSLQTAAKRDFVAAYVKPFLNPSFPLFFYHSLISCPPSGMFA